MSERIPITVYLTPAEYKRMAARANNVRPGMQVHHLIEASIARSCQPSPEEQYRARLDAIRDLHERGLNDREISERLQLSGNTVWRLRSVVMDLPKNDTRGGTRTPNTTKESTR